MERSRTTKATRVPVWRGEVWGGVSRNPWASDELTDAWDVRAAIRATVRARCDEQGRIQRQS